LGAASSEDAASSEGIKVVGSGDDAFAAACRGQNRGCWTLGQRCFVGGFLSYYSEQRTSYTALKRNMIPITSLRNITCVWRNIMRKRCRAAAERSDDAASADDAASSEDIKVVGSGDDAFAAACRGQRRHRESGSRRRFGNIRRPAAGTQKVRHIEKAQLCARFLEHFDDFLRFSALKNDL
jgi:hypothetical protein